MAVGSVTVKHIHLPGNSTKFVVDGTVERIPCKILLDSGASVSCVSSKLIKKHKILSSNRQLFTAAGTKLDSAGQAHVSLSLGVASTTSMKVEVINGLAFDCILGVDGLSKLNVTLQFGEKSARNNEEDMLVTMISDVEVGATITNDQRHELVELLKRYTPLFDDTLGCTTTATHQIRTGDKGPIRRHPYRIPLAKQKIVEKHVQEMLQKNVILPSSSPWCSPIVLTKKKDGTDRFCIDFTEVNKITEKDASPLPRIDDLLDRLGKAKFFSGLDLASGYWQIKMDESDRKKTAFTVPGVGHFEFSVMPFGLTNAPATFSKMMQQVLRGIKNAVSYLDDILIFSETWAEHLSTIEVVLRALQAAGLKLQPKKCSFVKRSLSFLGHIVDENGVTADPKKTEAIANYPRPQNEKQLKGFLGFANYYRRFVKDFAKIASCLFKMTSKKQKFEWKAIHEDAFNKLKQKLCSTPVLGFPDLTLPYELHVDACGLGMGCVLSQRHDGFEKPIAYASRHFTKQEEHYSATEREAAAVIWALNHFHPYLDGAQFRIVSDHEPLRWLLAKPITRGRLARWQLKLREYQDSLLGFDYRPGSKHANADFLSRTPLLDEVRDQARVEDTDQSFALVSSIIDVSVSDLKEMQERDADFDRMKKHFHEDKQGIWKYRKRVYIPVQLRKRVMESFHGTVDSSHMGITKMHSLIATSCYWPKMLSDIQNFVTKCSPCAFAKDTRAEQAPIGHFSQCDFPFQRVALDFAGPFPTSERGKKYLIVGIDHFSRFVYAQPTSTATSLEAATFLRHICNLEGTPSEVLTDNGTHFKGHFKLFLESRGIRHVLSSPHHPQSNGMAERFMRTVKGMIRAELIQKMDTNQTGWDAKVDTIVRDYNMALVESTRVSPFELARGRVVTSHNLRWLKGCPQGAVRSNVKWDDIAAHEKGRREKTVNRINDKNKRVLRQLSVGMMVKRRNFEQKVGHSQSLMPKYDGPFEIMRQVSPFTYEIGIPGRSWRQILHVDHLLPFQQNDEIQILPNPVGRPKSGGGESVERRRSRLSHCC